MTNTLFTSDLHLGHSLVSGIRGFRHANGEPDTDAHDATLIANWRKVVKPLDTVWVQGDLAVRDPAYALSVMADLPGKKHLIMGNHDVCSSIHPNGYKHVAQYLEVFESVQPYARFRLRGQDVLLSHFPYLGGDGDDHTEVARYQQWRLPNLGAWLLHGHTHMKDQRLHDGKQIHVGLDAWGLSPVKIGDIDRIIAAYDPTPEGPVMSNHTMDMVSDAKASTIAAAHSLSDIDGHGDEGAGYDYAVFAKNLEAAGWSYQPKGLKGWVVGYEDSEGVWVTLSVSYDGEDGAQLILDSIRADAEKYAAYPKRMLDEARNKDWAERAALAQVSLEVRSATAFSMHTLPNPSVDRVASVIDDQWPGGGNSGSMIHEMARSLVDKEIVRQYGPSNGPYRFLMNAFDSAWASVPKGEEVDFSSRPGRAEIVRAVAEAILAADHLYVDGNIPLTTYTR